MDDKHPIRVYREAKGLTQAQLADMLSVNRTTVVRWEMGRQKVDRRLWQSISKATGIPIVDLSGVSELEAAQ